MLVALQQGRLTRAFGLVVLVAGALLVSSCAIERAAKSEADHQQTIEQLMADAASSYHEHDFERAGDLYQSVFDRLEQSLGPDDFTVALAANHLGEVRRAQGLYAEAEMLFQRATAILDGYSPSKDQTLADVLNNQGLLYLDTGDYTQAEASLSRAQTLLQPSLEHDPASVAVTINNLALLYKTLGRYPEALDYYRQARNQLQDASPAGATLAVTLGNLASLHLELGDYAEAGELFQQALDLRQNALGPSHPGLAVPLTNLASLHYELGDYDQAMILYRRALSLYGQDKKAQTSLKATGLLSNLAALRARLGDYAEAESLYRQVITIQRAHLPAQHPAIADSLGDLGRVYQIQGEYTEAESHYRQALNVRLQTFGTDHVKVARSKRNLGELYLITGAFGRAEPLLQQAGQLSQDILGQAHPQVAYARNSLALMYRILGDYARSEKLYTQTLDTLEAIYGRDHPEIAMTLHNMALLFYYQQKYERAESLVRRALAIQHRKLPSNHPQIALNQVALARILLENGAYSEAQELLERALPVQQQVHGEDHARFAFTMATLAKTHKLRGDSQASATAADHEYALAKSLYFRALTIATGSGQPEVLWRVQYGLSQLFEVQNNPYAAIFFGYEAVSTLQSLRKALSPLDKELQQSFLTDRYQVYRHLAALLISQQHIPEAQQVLGMLKEAEYFDFVRRSPGDPATDIDLKDVAMFSRYFEFRDDLVSKSREYREDYKAIELEAEEDKRLDELRQTVQIAMKDFRAYLKKFESELEALRDGPPEFPVRTINKRGLKGHLRKLGPGWVSIHVLITHEQLHLILTTPHIQLVRYSTVKAEDLHQTVFRFHNALKTGSDPAEIQMLARQLHDWVIAPLADDLKQADATNLALSLDGSLRYVPIAALHDGRQYLVENYNVVLFNETTESRFFQPRSATDWRIAGFGAVKAPSGFELEDLPAVRDEINGIVIEEGEDADVGVLPGVAFFDQDFSERNLIRLLELQRYSVFHVAGHFSVNPGTMRNCKFFLGDGNVLSLETIKLGETFPYEFDKELVTLSACNTAVGGSVFGSGIEVESFATLAQDKGANSVLATLWPVSDDSTGLLMQLFYHFKVNEQLSKAEALRKAQLELLHADQPGAASAVRGIVPHSDTSNIGRYSHPYHWAPFVLMGNAL